MAGVFFDIGWANLLVLALVGFFVLGPERLPKVAADAARLVRRLREMASDATRDLRAELDPGLAQELAGLRELHPRRFVASLLEDPAGTPPFSDNGGGVPAPRPAPAAAGPVAGTPAPPFDPDAT